MAAAFSYSHRYFSINKTFIIFLRLILVMQSQIQINKAFLLKKWFTLLAVETQQCADLYNKIFHDKKYHIGSMNKATRNNNSLHQKMSLITKLQKINI